MNDAWQGARAMSAATGRSGYGLEWKIPTIPLWVSAEARRELTDLVLQTVRLILQALAGRISQEAPVNSGALAQSFGSDPATQEGGIELFGAVTSDTLGGRVFSALPWAIVMEEGRRPGAPISRVGIDAIGLWAQRKLGLDAEEADRAKWAIAASIVAQGIQGLEYVAKAFAGERPTIEATLSRLSEDIAAALVGRTG